MLKSKKPYRPCTGHNAIWYAATQVNVRWSLSNPSLQCPEKRKNNPIEHYISLLLGGHTHKGDYQSQWETSDFEHS